MDLVYPVVHNPGLNTYLSESHTVPEYITIFTNYINLQYYGLYQQGLTEWVSFFLPHSLVAPNPLSSGCRGTILTMVIIFRLLFVSPFDTGDSSSPGVPLSAQSYDYPHIFYMSHKECPTLQYIFTFPKFSDDFTSVKHSVAICAFSPSKIWQLLE